MKYIDLHIHSTFSDGTVTPAGLVELAVKQGLSAFALTDHDTARGVPEAQAEAAALRKQGVEIHVIPGVEISSAFRGSDIHILGLNIDTENDELCHAMNTAEEARHNRNRKMAENLASAGLDITYEAIASMEPEAVITRAHFARFLVNKGYAATNSDAFKKYLNTKSPYYVPRTYPTPEETIALILKAGGIPILAHPLLYHLEEGELKRLILRLKDAGLMGLEAIYSCNSRNDEAFVKGLARKNGLLISGGSDFHGKNKPDIQMGIGKGNLKIPYELLDNMGILLDK